MIITPWGDESNTDTNTVLQPSVGLLFYSKSNDGRQAKQAWTRQTADILLHFLQHFSLYWPAAELRHSNTYARAAHSATADICLSAFLSFLASSSVNLSHSGSLFSSSTVAAGDTLTDCGSWWAGDEDKVEMESHVRSVEHTLCSFLHQPVEY